MAVVIPSTTKTLADWTPQEVAELARRLENDDYEHAFDALADWQVLKALQYRRPQLVDAYVHLLELEEDES
ncbi:MAG: DUF2555 domain-containing protein [Aphanocapsa lilacina HA4352-LM1]|jgi:hypothetical protein|nr:DUF2555 domain-containing protein [Aphanocapsa lilacina HA4352-LM1]